MKWLSKVLMYHSQKLICVHKDSYLLHNSFIVDAIENEDQLMWSFFQFLKSIILDTNFQITGALEHTS